MSDPFFRVLPRCLADLSPAVLSKPLFYLAPMVYRKQLTAFTDYRFPSSQGDHVSLPEYCAYLERYAHEFDLWEMINLDSRVVRVEKGKGGKEGHVVSVQREGEKGEKRRRRKLDSRVRDS